jgi:hypothetical protein
MHSHKILYEGKAGTVFLGGEERRLLTMAYRDAEMVPYEFLQYVLGLKRKELMGVGGGPVITVVDGCKGYLVSEQRKMLSRIAEAAAMRTAWEG